METRTASFGGVVVMALVWALVWAFPGMVIELVDNLAPAARPFTRRIDMWPQTLGLPGLAAGALFALLLPITEGRRRLAGLPLARAGAWGVVSGLVVAVVVVWVLDAGLSDPWQLAAAVTACAAALGGVAGVVSPVVLRRAGGRRAGAMS